jgi:aspartyl protease family protein
MVCCHGWAQQGSIDMGLEDRDWLHDARRQKELQARKSAGAGMRWGTLGILAFWLVVMGGLYVAMQQVLKPKSISVNMTGDLVIPRDRDGHFYAPGTINGQPVRFLVDTGASLVVVSEAMAQSAGLAQGESTVFQTANGALRGRTVSGVPVSVGPASVSGVRVGVGLVGLGPDAALLGQSFLSKFEVVLSGEQMILRRRS